MFQSTRGPLVMKGLDAVMQGIAPDGGLFVPINIPHFAIETMLEDDYPLLAMRILQPFFPDINPLTLEEMISKAISNFATPEVTPLREHQGSYFLELFHGPTMAFKDVALSLLPHFYELGAINREYKQTILVATSGDTGSATLAGFSQIPNTKVIVLYPHQGISRFQEAQMLQYQSEHMKSIALEGNFDDCQKFVKEILTHDTRFTSANSINLGRLLPQIVYYFSAYIQMVRDHHIIVHQLVNFSVPTGNFGNVLAGYMAKMMGLPIHRLIVASNQNNVLTDFFETGTYNRNRPFHITNSPSMDILVSSNLERLLWWIGGEQEVNRCMTDLKKTGTYTITKDMKNKLDTFVAGYATIEETNETIQAFYHKTKVILDPHTAVATKVAADYVNKTHDITPTIIVATADYRKFMDVIHPLLPDVPPHASGMPLTKQRIVWSKDNMQEAFNQLTKEMKI